ncbi:hypothetical protein ACQ4PT_003202 [Festuca glaucescens]
MARLRAALLLLAVAASATALAHGHDLPTSIKLTRGAVVGGDSNECVYTVYVRTGSIWKAGTDAMISLELTTADNYDGVEMTDLPSWGGLMYEGHSYFERGNLDIFSGRGACMASTPCRMRVSSDGSGDHHGWYCNYVEVTVTGPHRGCAQQLFTVEQWLATDVSPYKLEAVVDHCSYDDGAASASGQSTR